jgi:predicted DNA-binding transcriptional regulator YafY
VSRFDRIYKIHDKLRTAREPRKVHPQKLPHYRPNWYLLAHCRQANALRLFSLDRIAGPDVNDAEAKMLATGEPDAFTSSSFRIFGGDPKDTAHLRFSDHSAQWVADETWHAEQMGEWREDGYHLKVPCSDEGEIAMEVLRYGAEVEVFGAGGVAKRSGSRNPANGCDVLVIYSVVQ